MSAILPVAPRGVRIGMWGGTSSGKTAYLAALGIAAFDPENPDLIISSEDETSDLFLTPATNVLYRDRTFPRRVDRSLPNHHQRPRGRHRIPLGEVAEQVAASEPPLKDHGPQSTRQQRAEASERLGTLTRTAGGRFALQAIDVASTYPRRVLFESYTQSRAVES